MEEKAKGTVHRLTLERRLGGTVTGVKDVTSFDEKEILLMTEEGRMSIKGEGLHVQSLNLENGQVQIQGKVDSINYLSRSMDKKDESLLKRMFR